MTYRELSAQALAERDYDSFLSELEQSLTNGRRDPNEVVRDTLGEIYFGRPYALGAYPDGYGYYAIAPGRAYGAVRIVDAPPDAQVFVDGYYAGVVDDYDGVFQHLNLEAGAHHIEIETAGYQPFAFDVRVDPGRTITYHARIY